MKLKTLKDLMFSDYIVRKLKAEAVKWVKFYQKMKRFDKEIAFRHFFNITEEDLKKGDGE